VDITWRDGKLVEARIHSDSGHPARLRYGAVTRELALKENGNFTWNAK
jgi:hypothetical protein